ncbi:MAG TPA: hypothetical protein VGK90_11405 [Rhizomicrobium sp.]|jgi:hypothetical protein
MTEAGASFGGKLSKRFGRTLRSLPLGIVLALTGFSIARATAPSADIDTFESTYHCAVTASIARIHAHPHPEQMYRYLVLENAVTHRYVQCLFFDSDRQMLCEAWSGWWEQKNSGPKFRSPLAPEQLAALSKLGFSMDVSHGNFQRRFRFGGVPDYEGVADLMLRALYSGYNTTLATGVRGEGPYAMRKTLLSKNSCIPIS